MKFSFYRKHLKRKLFNKIFLIYSAIIVLSLLALSILITSSLTQTLKQKELNSNIQLLGIISSYFDRKYYSSLNITQQIYANNEISSDLTSFLKYDYNNYLSNRLNIFSGSTSSSFTSFQTYFNTFFIRDRDIINIVIYSTKNDLFYVSDKDNRSRFVEFGQDTKKLVDDLSLYKRQYYPYLFCENESSSDSQKVFSTISSINDPYTLNRIGSLIINYKLDEMYSLIQKYSHETKGYMLILTNEGNVLFDSSNRYYGSKYPYFHSLSNVTGTTLLEEKSYVNIINSLDSGAIIAGILPEKQIMSSTVATRTTIFLIAFFLIVGSILLTYFIINTFSKRTKVIMQGMEELKKGNLAIRVPISKSEDELSQIAENFNNMCNSLNDYINKVYLSEIKQKNTELMALQSQINPHFLYNTLEAIRMKAVSMGAATVGEMVFILASLLRNSIKGETFIPISVELEHCKLYLQLFRLRNEERLTYEIDVQKDITNFSIVKFILQPIIENYILHGMIQGAENNIIKIKGYLDGTDIHFIISDNGTGIENNELEHIKNILKDNVQNTTTTIGLTNVNERLKLIYGSNYGLDISSEVNSGTTVEIRIPAKKKEDLNEYVQGIPGR